MECLLVQTCSSDCFTQICSDQVTAARSRQRFIFEWAEIFVVAEPPESDQTGCRSFAQIVKRKHTLPTGPRGLRMKIFPYRHNLTPDSCDAVWS